MISAKIIISARTSTNKTSTSTSLGNTKTPSKASHAISSQDTHPNQPNKNLLST